MPADPTLSCPMPRRAPRTFDRALVTMGAALALAVLGGVALTGAARLAASPPAAATASPTTMPLPTFDLPPGPGTAPEPERERSQPQIQPQSQPQAQPQPQPEAQPRPLPVPAPTSAPAASPAPAPTGDPSPGTEAAQPPPGETAPAALPISPPEPAAPAAAPNSSALGASLLPAWWPLAAGALGGLGVMAILLLARRIRKPGVPRLAAPAPRTADDAGADSEAAPAKLDCQLAILAAARSVMMFTIEYRLEIANRSARAVRDLQVTTRLGYPGRTGEEAALVPSAESIQTIERIGPHQSRSITGTLRLPLAEIAPIRQGASPLLIPLLHLILEGTGHPRETRVFVAGTPSPANLGRLQPIRLDTTPGGIAGVRALPVNAP